MNMLHLKHVVMVSFLIGLLIAVNGCQNGAGGTLPAGQPLLGDTSDGLQTASNASAAVKTFALNLSNYKIEPQEIEVQVGDRVRLLVTNIQGTHGFAIPWFGVHVGEIPEGSTVTVEFLANKAIGTEVGDTMS